MITQFINTGADARTLASLSPDILRKSYGKIDKSKLVPMKVVVNSKNGTYTKTVYKAIEKDQHKTTKRQNKPEEEKKPTKPTKPPMEIQNPNHMYMDLESQEVFSLDEIQSIYDGFSDKEKKEHGNLDNYIKSNYFISDGKTTTAEMYRTSPGRYTAYRFSSVHKPIIDYYKSQAQDPPNGMAPVMFLYGGGSGSGKSTVVESIVKPFSESMGIEITTVDCDAIKPMLPEHDMFSAQNPDTTASREHRESSDITNSVIHELTKSGKCFAYDGCMGNTYKYKQIIDYAHQQGYDVHIIATDIPVDMAIDRSKNRERKLDEKTVRRAHKDFGINFLDIAAMADTFALYDNTQPPGQPPTLVVDDQGIHNEEYYKRFLLKQTGEA